MCGIVGYVGEREAIEVLVNGLSKLEYRGYDSAGVAVIEDKQIKVKKCKGRLKNLEAKLKEKGTDVHYFPSFTEIENFLLKNCINGDLLITMGAGDIVKVGEKLLGK